MSLYAKFDVRITTNNPNKKIGIFYEKGGRLSVWYTNTRLCEGSLPQFYQGHQNKTMLNVSLTGQVQSGSTLMTALQQQQQIGRVPLDLKVHAPVSIKLGRLKLRKVSVLGECIDVQKKLDKLEKRTQKALYQLMVEQEKQKQLAEGDDTNGTAE
ncbi:hypothetical protein Fmac_024408 [Flemingia macrophylla]|uniref:Late embryogenesis abundant protein LEA-2 subgroup domain-containing protein n=1 Tax=Flemingia macrophylla TaxID=520843 RepID=A0ABD1LP97_9FABA